MIIKVFTHQMYLPLIIILKFILIIFINHLMSRISLNIILHLDRKFFKVL